MPLSTSSPNPRRAYLGVGVSVNVNVGCAAKKILELNDHKCSEERNYTAQYNGRFHITEKWGDKEVTSFSSFDCVEACRITPASAYPMTDDVNKTEDQLR